MSLNAYGDDKHAAGAASAGAAALTQAPRLRAGGYAAWRPDMEVFLARIGADGAHKRKMEKAHWLQLVQRVHTWQEEALADALADIGIDVSSDSTSSSSSSSGNKASLSEREQSTRKTIRQLVEHSTKAYGAIWSALSEELRAQASKGGEVPPNFAYGLWTWLEHKFQSTETDSIGELLAQWTALRQDEEETFDAYRARVNHLRELLMHAKEPPSDNMYSFMLLDRLQPRYKQVVLALKAGNQLTDASKVAWDSVAALINAHERSEQRLGTETGAMAHAAHAQSRRGGGAWGAASASNSAFSNPQRQTFSSSTGQRENLSRRRKQQPEQRTCFRCDQKGHLAAVCTNPPKQSAATRQASPGSRREGRNEQASSVTSGASNSSWHNRFSLLSSDEDSDPEDNSDSSVEWPALPSQSIRQRSVAGPAVTDSATVQKDKPKPTCALSGGGAEAPSRSDPATKPADVLEQAQAAPQLEAALSSSAWGWDTMASACCSGNRARFATLRKCAAVPVKVADGNVVEATHIGSVPLRVKLDNGRVVRIVIHDVLYHKRFASNLLSGELLTSKYGWQYHSTPEGTYVVTPGGDRVTLSRRGRVSVLMGAEAELQVPQRSYSAQEASAAPGDGMAVHVTVADVEQLVRLHERLNHMGWTRMLATLRSGRVDDLGVNLSELGKGTLAAAEKKVRECAACIQGRATRTPFGHRGLDRGQKPGECLHMDTYPIKVEREGRQMIEYGLVIKCLFSGYVWHAQLLSKDRVASAVSELIRLVETQFERTVKRLYADGGSEFINQTLRSFCAKNGKELHWTPARTQELNGGAERTVRTFKDYERMMVAHAGAPVRFWGRAGAHAAFVWNRSHIARDTGMTPYEAMRGKKPSVRHLAVWGCDAFCHVPREHRAAMAPKAEPCIYLGHNEAQNAANVLLLSTQKIICTRDVAFRSGSFSFMRALAGGDDELRQALTMGDEYADSEIDDGRPTASAQGGRLGGKGLDPESNQDSDREYVVESIVGRRTKNGRVQYKVHWAGFDASEDTWEPEAEVRHLAAFDAWQAQQPQARRSQRLAQTTSRQNQEPANGENHASDRLQPEPQNRPAEVEQSLHSHSDESDEEPQVHMAMCALRELQLPEERPQTGAMLSALTTGIAALEQQTPRTYREAMASPDAAKWKAALEKEMRSCTEQQVWSLVRRADLPPRANVLPCKEVFKVKLDEHGSVSEYKARFTPKGFRQKHGVDFFETFARTGQYKTLRVALSLVAKWDHELAQFDVPTAFLNAEVDEDIYMELPAGFEQPGMVCKLHKSLYGLKQAPRNWDRLIHNFLITKVGFKAPVSDPSLYYKRSRSGRLMLIYRFVDDMQGSYHAEDAVEFEQCVRLLQDRFRIKQMQTATWMLGMRIQRDRKLRTITLSQELYVTKALEKFGLQECRVVSTPELVGAASEQLPSLETAADRQRYMEITGTLMYAAISTRPDIAHAVHYLASHMQEPTKRHMQAAERVLRYLAGTKDVGLVFGSRNGDAVGDSRGRKAQVQVDVCAFADADWANDKGDRKSVSGWVAKLNGDPVSWSSKKQRVVALSTCEAELYAEAAAIQEVLWLRGLMEELGLHTQTGSTVFGDNQSAIAISENGVKGERTKHVDVKYHFVTETVERGAVKLRWVPTTQQQADIFTKALSPPVFLLLRGQLMTR